MSRPHQHWNSKAEFTTKFYRTWAGTLQVMCSLTAQARPANEAETKREIRQAICAAANLLGNTPAVCRKHYVHPVILKAYGDGDLVDIVHACSPKGARALHDRERVLMRILRSASR